MVTLCDFVVVYPHLCVLFLHFLWFCICLWSIYIFAVVLHVFKLLFLFLLFVSVNMLNLFALVLLFDPFVVNQNVFAFQRHDFP